MKEITVTILDGEVEIKTKGFQGKACQLETADLERDLGRTTADKETAEMRATATQSLKTGRS